MARTASMLEVFNTTRGTSVARHVRVADTFAARGRGLMFARTLADDSGLLIDPCSSIHMFFMRFALDVLYVSKDDRVVRAQRNIRPWRIGPLRTVGARYVIELPVGTIERSGTQVADQLSLRPPTPSAPP